MTREKATVPHTLKSNLRLGYRSSNKCKAIYEDNVKKPLTIAVFRRLFLVLFTLELNHRSRPSADEELAKNEVPLPTSNVGSRSSASQFHSGWRMENWLSANTRARTNPWNGF